MTNPKLLNRLVGVAVVVGAMWGMARCYSYHLNLHDCYYITRYVKHNGDRYYFLGCNPGYPLREGVSRVDDVKSVAWNSRLIVVEQMAGGTEETGESTTPDTPHEWWIVPAAGEELRCGVDTILGPMSETEKDAWLTANPPTERLKRRRY